MCWCRADVIFCETFCAGDTESKLSDNVHLRDCVFGCTCACDIRVEGGNCFVCVDVCGNGCAAAEHWTFACYGMFIVASYIVVCVVRNEEDRQYVLPLFEDMN